MLMDSNQTDVILMFKIICFLYFDYVELLIKNYAFVTNELMGVLLRLTMSSTLSINLLFCNLVNFYDSAEVHIDVKPTHFRSLLATSSIYFNTGGAKNRTRKQENCILKLFEA